MSTAGVQMPPVHEGRGFDCHGEGVISREYAPTERLQSLAHHVACQGVFQPAVCSWVL